MRNNGFLIFILNSTTGANPFLYSVRVERHQGAKKVTTQTLPAKPEGKKPWIPASVKILNCENQKLRKEKQKFSAVKHVG